MSFYNLPPRNPSLVPEFVRALPEDGHGKLAIFDADGTMWRNDVADDFTKWMIDSGHVDTGGNWQKYLGIYRDDHAAGCRFLLSFYAGLTRGQLNGHLRRWWKDVANRQWVPEVVESLHLLAARGYSNWVVTGSPTDTMLPLKDFLPVHEVVGMDFELDGNGVITGRHHGISCADEGKAVKVRSLWPDEPILFAAGNGKLDTAMLELSTGVRWSVYPNAAFLQVSRNKGWHVTPRPADFVEEAKLA